MFPSIQEERLALFHPHMLTNEHLFVYFSQVVNCIHIYVFRTKKSPQLKVVFRMQPRVTTI